MKKITLILLMMFFSYTSFSQLPEGFEGTSLPSSGNWVLPSGTWKIFDNGIGLAQSWNVIPAPNACTGTRSAYLNRENVTDGTFAEDWLVAPLTTVPVNGQLRFLSRLTQAGNQGSVYTIRVSTTSQTVAGSFTTIQTWTETEINSVFNDCEEKVVSLSAYAGQSVYVAFVMTNDNGDRWIIDDVNVVEQCLDPTTQTATSPTLTTSNLGWSNPSGASQWEVEVIGTGITPTGVGVITGSNPYTATGLTQGTCYDFYVRALCTSGSKSEWIGPYNFCTVALGATCGASIPISSLPYTTTNNTSGFGDNYSGSPGSSGCGTTGSYLNGDDVFYSFTATNTSTITITSQTNSTWSGLFVYSNCANIGVSCVAGSTAGNGTTTPDSVTFTPTVGQTYYVVISSWATPQSVPYTLTIVENSCTNMTASFAVVSNCTSTANPNTFFVTANVTNMGSATSIVGVTNPASTTQTITAAGTMQFGPFANNTNVTINLQNAADANCFRNSTVLTQTFCPAPNNLCDNAIPVTCASTVNGTTQGSTSVGAPAAYCGTASNSSPGVWYSFMGNGDVVTFSLCGSPFNTKMQVLTGTCGAFTCVTGNDDSCGTQSEVQITTTTGTLYYIYVFGSTNTTSGTFTLNTTCITPPPPPANDNCTAATTVPVNTDGSCTLLTAGTVVGATPSTQANACVGTADDDVWFSFTATQSTQIITLQDIAGSTLDLNHVLYTSTNTTNPCGNLTQVLCSNPNLSVASSLVVGQVYYIRVYTAVATLLQTTTFNLCVSVPPPPPANDDCSAAINAVVNPSIICASVTPGTISSATASPQTNICTGSADDDVWFTFTATANIHNINLNNIQGTTSDLAFAVYSGANCTSLTQIYCQTNNNGVAGGLTVGTVYWIRVYSEPSTPNLIANFDLCITTPVQCNSAQTFCGDNQQYINQTGLASYGGIGCLFTTPNPFWFQFTVETSGSITFTLQQTTGPNGTGTGIDVDFVLWGPFTDAQMDTNACNSLYDYPDGNLSIPNNIIDCSYSAASIESIDIPNAIAGQNYLLLVTNYGNASGYFSLPQTGGAGSASCCNVVLGNDVTLCDQTSYNIVAATTNDDTIKWFKDNVLIPGQSLSTLTVTQSGTYKCEITCGQLTKIDEVVVTFNTSVAPTFDPLPTNICINGTAPALLPQSLNGIDGLWNPSTINTSVASTTATEYVFTPNPGICASTYSVFVTIDALTVPTFAFAATENICQGITPPDLPTTSINGVNGTWNALSIDTSTQGGPTTYTFTPDAGQCAASYSFNVIIDAPSIAPTFAFAATENICQGITAPDLLTTSINGINGTWNVASIDTSTQGGPTTYTFTPDASQCAVSYSFNVIIDAPTIVPTFSFGLNYCSGSTSITLPTTSDNGIDGTWNVPSINTTILGMTPYVFTSVGNQCSQPSLTVNVTITPTPVASTVVGSNVCIGALYTFPALVSGTYYSGSMGTGTMHSAGDQVMINSTQTFYVYAQSGTTPNCTNETSFTVTAVSIPVVTLTGGCLNNAYTLTATVTTGESVTYQWSNSSGEILGATSSTYVATQDGMYSCQVTSAGQLCESESVAFAANGTVCTIQKGISPNNDGSNDNFDLKGLNVKRLEIFNRYGKKVYSFSNYTDQWYGQSNDGKELPTGTYYFVIERDSMASESGWIYINR
jgi:gliding motility-associated-like protein